MQIYVQSPFGISHQQALLAHVTVQAVIAQLNMQMPANYHKPTIVTTSNDEPLTQHSSFTLNDANSKQKVAPSENISHANKKYQMLSSLATDKPSNDGYNWRKYGQKQVKGSEFPRSYYKCTHVNCYVKKKVERASDGHIIEIIYKGQHNHAKPHAHRRVKVNSNENTCIHHAKSESKLNTHQAFWVGNSNKLGGEELGDCFVLESDQNQDFNQRAPSDNEDMGDVDIREEGDYSEPNPKRRNTDIGVSKAPVPHKTITEPKIIVQTRSEVDILDDGYRWRKYGQKMVKGNPHPRSYYKCTSAGCNVRKHVERASMDPKAVITTYEGKHNHDVPAARNVQQPQY
ncbi:probable WRKY transcription factor 4 isoform X3 [Abrus precatorius]|uniref:Probable WRKY transcription factor 4 isoform X3 n=1 Tax=Abrus precatorius TaxID=3816 RepID=A0A8B8LR80_ABRPR|nr:probable WRKY transcription factor 4 isoform X3 [Abrus precatorius]